jgi:hypothetical protein
MNSKEKSARHHPFFGLVSGAFLGEEGQMSMMNGI